MVACLCIAVLLTKCYKDDDYELSGMTDLSGLVYLTVFQPCDHLRMVAKVSIILVTSEVEKAHENWGWGRVYF